MQSVCYYDACRIQHTRPCYISRNSSIPPVHDIPCDKLSQDKEELQSLIDSQVSLNFHHLFLMFKHDVIIYVCFQKEQEVEAQEVIQKENETLHFPCSLTEMNSPK